LQLRPPLSLDLSPFGLPRLFVLLLHLFLVELSSSLFSTNHAFEVIFALLGVEGYGRVFGGLTGFAECLFGLLFCHTTI